MSRIRPLWIVFASLCGLACVQPAPRGGTDPIPEGGGEMALEEEAPLLLDDEPLLLLDEGDEESLAAPLADNSRCHVCHINYETEDIALIHARADMGCGECHGDCDAHIADESWASGGNGTPPGIMYRPHEINPMCMKCHPREEIDIDEHEDLLVDGEGVCTDCHGEHRLPIRRCKWK